METEPTGELPMAAPENRLQRTLTRIKSSPLIVLFVFLSTVVIGLSTFTNAAKNLIALMPERGGADVGGQWSADVVYDWNDARYTEIFLLRQDGKEVSGTATFLGYPRAVLEGSVRNDKISFVTKTQEGIGDEPAKGVVHRYQGKVVADAIQFTLQTEGGYSEHVPISFTAVRVNAAETGSGKAPGR